MTIVMICIALALLSAWWGRGEQVEAQEEQSHFQTPPSRRKRGLGTLERFLGLAHHHQLHVTAHVPIQIYANNHMIAELAEPSIGTNIPRPLP